MSKLRAHGREVTEIMSTKASATTQVRISD